MITFIGSAADPEDGDLTSRLVWTSNIDGIIGNGGSFTDYLTAGTHSIVVEVTDSDGATSTKMFSVVVTNPNLLIAPTNLTASVVGREVTLAWNDNSNNETGFAIERANKRGAKKYAVVAVVGANSKTYTYNVLDNGSYLYRVRAFNATSTSAYSNTVTVTLK